MKEQNRSHFVLYRPELDEYPAIGLPVYPRSCGCFFRRRGELEHVPAGEKNFVQLFWTVSGEGATVIGGETFRMPPESVFLRYPGEEHHLEARTDWRYRWVVFDGPQAEEVMRSYGYPTVPFPAGPCPQENFVRFQNLMLQRTPWCYRMMVAEIFFILAAAGGKTGSGALQENLVRKIITLCRERFSDPELNVNALAAELSVSRGKLWQSFRAEMQQSPAEYLAQLRLQQALSLLKESRTPLAEIAPQCGFRDVNYFCRFIRQRTGRSPAQLR